MKKVISIIIILLALASLTRCKVYEEVSIEKIENPTVDIDSIVIPPWNPAVNAPSFEN